MADDDDGNDFLLRLIRRSIGSTPYSGDPTNPIGTYSPDETGQNPMVAQAQAQLAANMKKFAKAKPPPPQPPPDLPIQTPAALSPDETGASPIRFTPAPDDPLAAALRQTGDTPTADVTGTERKGEKKTFQPSPPITQAQIAAGMLPGFVPAGNVLGALKLIGQRSMAGARTEPEVAPPISHPETPQEVPASEWTPGSATDRMGPEGVPPDRSLDTPSERLGHVPQGPREVSGDPAAGAGGGKGDQGQTATPAGATPTQGQGGPAEALGRAGMLDSSGPGDFFGKIMQGLHEHSNLLLGMGAGLMGAPNVWQGLGRGFAYAGPAAQQDIQMQQTMGGRQATMNALLSAGVPHDLAMAGAMNPKLGEQLLTQFAISPKMEVKPIEDQSMFGGKTTRLLAYDPTGRRAPYYLEPGQQPGAGGGGGGGGPAVAGGGQGGGQPQSPYFAPGVSEQNLDQTKLGDAFLAQFSPMVKQDVISYLHGTFNPQGRGQGYAQAIKSIADKFGTDTGMRPDAATIGQRQKFENELADPNRGWGGRKAGLQQSLEHFNTIVDNVYQMGLHAGPGIPGGEQMAGAWNALNATNPNVRELINRNSSLATPFARELGKMAGGSSVGEAEKLANSVTGGFQSRQAAVGALEGVRDYIKGSLHTMESNRDDLYPDERYRPQGSEFMEEKQKRQLADIEEKIAILKGEKKAPKGERRAAAAASAPAKSGTYDAQGNLVSSQ